MGCREALNELGTCSRQDLVTQTRPWMKALAPLPH
jgi:hypothetical protein